MKYFEVLFRRKTITNVEENKLARVLNVFDLTFLGVGSTLGLGAYVLAGSVAKTIAGPAVCISFIIASIASLFAAVCYAEFAARVPNAGSAYAYSYVCVGEIIAFTIGWNYVSCIGASGLGKGLSAYIDSLCNNTIENTMREYFPMNAKFLAPYPDFLSFSIIIILTIVLALGAKQSAEVNNLMTILNLLTIITVIIAGAFKANPYNWKIPKNEIPPKYQDVAGNGGFMPFGVTGIVQGASRSFYGFVGFDTIATTGEEARNPKRDMPRSIVYSLLIVFVAYMGVAIVLTMMWPYYDQNEEAPFPYVFKEVGWPIVEWFVSIGAIFALMTSLLGALFVTPRIMYSMATDGLIFKFFAKVHHKRKTPVNAVIFSGILSGIFSLFLNLNTLMDVMSIGTLITYTIVATSVLILRYKESKENEAYQEDSNKADNYFKTVMLSLWNIKNQKNPSTLSSKISIWCIILFSILSFLILFFCVDLQINAPFVNYYIFIIGAVVLLLLVLILLRQPKQTPDLLFTVSFVPIVPCLSIVFNAYLLAEFNLLTWMYALAWFFLGFLVYFSYGWRHSQLRIRN